VEALEAERARATKDSSHSSTPPSSARVNPPKAAPQAEGKRKPGAHRGHARHERPLFSPHESDTAWGSRRGSCPDCGGGVAPGAEPPRILQPVELLPRPIASSDHRGRAGSGPQGPTTPVAPSDEPVVRAGRIGPRLSAGVASLKGVCQGSCSTLRQVLRDGVRVTLRRGHLAKLIAQVTARRDATSKRRLDMLPDESFLKGDETGHTDCGQRMGTGCVRAALVT
jgi:hypothetical protein